jgi:NADH dehydrogenase (ubiquinone) Fe-S protein 4
MAVSLGSQLRQQCSQVHPSICKHEQSGTEEHLSLPLSLALTGIRIYKPSKTATQSGDWHGMTWLMDWDPLPKGHRWENPLIGWQSSADFMQSERIGFKSKEDAIRFANKQGYEYFVQEPNERRIIPKAYANQFVHSAKPLKIVRTK